jgi:non-ribosomal peptide synthetase component F
VRETARSERTTPFAVLLTCFGALLRAETGDDDVRLFTLHADRELPDLEPLVGLLLEPVLMRTRFDAGWSFLDALRAVRATVHEALAHQGVPALALVERVDELAEYLLESQFVAFECLPAAADPRLPDLTVRRTDQFSPGYEGASFVLPTDLLVVAREEGDVFRLALAHDPALFPGPRMRRLLDRYRNLVGAALADPAAPLAALAGREDGR